MSTRRTLAITAAVAVGVATGAVIIRQRARHQRELARHAALLVAYGERLAEYDVIFARIGERYGDRPSSPVRLVRQRAASR